VMNIRCAFASSFCFQDCNSQTIAKKHILAKMWAFAALRIVCKICGLLFFAITAE